MRRMYRMLMLALLILSLSACEDDDLPDPSQSGANMMAAKINGKPWQKNSSWSVMHGDGLDASYSGAKGYFWLMGAREADDFDNSIHLSLSGVKHTGDYTLKEKSSGNYAILNDYKERNNSKSYLTTAASTGRVTVTKLDTVNRIVSGTFSFRAYLQGSTTEYVNVTDGRFDVKY